MKSTMMICLVLLSYGGYAQHEHQPSVPLADTLKKSIAKEAHAQIGETHMMIKYHAPAVRGRTIWGGLVPDGEVWVTGAHMATSWEFNKDIVINGKTISAGKYAIFTIPNKEKWTLIVNKKWEQHLADDYDAKDDVLRLDVKPLDVPHRERLDYRIEGKAKKGEIMITWEKKRVVLPFEVSQ
ncbi:MAG: hypothetical protein OJF59_001688 [Cytophagales bacterium]|nr:MAG: hypothetical protein OJF59_001688 [Cytophagales bacterium]